jgi:hypothetical protein
MMVEVHGFLISSRQIDEEGTAMKVFDIFLDTDFENLTRVSVLSTDVLKWRYATLTINEEKDLRKTQKNRRVGYSIFEMDQDTADFVGVPYKQMEK